MLQSPRSRKTKRAPLPPSPASGLPPLPKDPPPSLHSPEASSLPPLPKSPPPRLQPIVPMPAEVEEVPSETVGEMMTQITEGMEKLIAQHEDIESPVVPLLTSKEEKDSVNECSKASSVLITDEVASSESFDETKIESFGHVSQLLYIDKDSDSISKEKNHEISVDATKSDDVVVTMKDTIYEIVKEPLEEGKLDSTDKTFHVVEAYNEEMVTASRNSSIIQFEEHNAAHSTPVKIIPLACMLDSSQEDVASSHSPSGTPFLSSPSVSCADSCSYQESLLSSPLDKKYKDSANMHKKISGNF